MIMNVYSIAFNVKEVEVILERKEPTLLEDTMTIRFSYQRNFASGENGITNLCFSTSLRAKINI